MKHFIEPRPASPWQAISGRRNPRAYAKRTFHSGCLVSPPPWRTTSIIYLFICSHTVLTPSPPGKILCVHDGNFDSYCVYCMGMWLSFYCLSQHTPHWQNFPRGSGSKGDSYPWTHIFPSFFLTLNSFTGRMAGGFRSMVWELACIHGMCVKTQDQGVTCG